MRLLVAFQLRVGLTMMCHEMPTTSDLPSDHSDQDTSYVASSAKNSLTSSYYSMEDLRKLDVTCGATRVISECRKPSRCDSNFSRI